jgi:hypothetical protein
VIEAFLDTHAAPRPALTTTTVDSTGCGVRVRGHGDS